MKSKAPKEATESKRYEAKEAKMSPKARAADDKRDAMMGIKEPIGMKNGGKVKGRY